MNQNEINDLFRKIFDDVENLAKATTKEYFNEAKADAEALINTVRENVINWSELLAEGKLSTEDFEWLIFRQKDLVAMNALKQAGLAEIRIEGFKQGVIGVIIDSVFHLLRI